MKRTAALAAGMLAASLAQAAPYTCTPTSNTIAFGTYNPLSASAVDGTGTFVIACTDAGGQKNKTTNVDYSIALSGQALRQLAPPTGSDRINFNVYTDINRTLVWGDGTAGSVVVTGTLAVPGKATASSAPINYYGRITGGQDVSATSPAPSPTTYSTNLTMTLTCTVAGVATAC